MSLADKLARLTFRYFSTICSFAVVLNWEEDAYLEKVSGFPLLIWYFREMCTFSTVPVFALNLHQTWRSYIDHRRISQLMINVFYLIVFPFCCTLQYMFIKHREEMIHLVNQTVKLARQLEDNYISKEDYDRDRKIRHSAVVLLLVGYFGQVCIVGMALFLMYPREGRYLSSYILTPYYDRGETRMVALGFGLLFEFWFLSTLWAGIILQIYFNLLYLQTMSTSLKGLRMVVGSASSRNKDMAITSMLKAYSKLELLSSLYNQAVGQLFLSRFKSTTAISCIASAFILVKCFSMKDPLIIAMSLGALILCVFVFTVMTSYCSRVHEESRQLRLYLLSQRPPGKVVSRQMKCYRVIGVRVGSFFLVKRATPLTMLAMISNTTMSMLISVNFSF